MAGKARQSHFTDGSGNVGRKAIHVMMDQEARMKDLMVTFKSSPSVACFCLLHPIFLNLHSLPQMVIGWGIRTRNMRLFQA